MIRSHRSGFSLIEAVVATCIIGVGVTALLSSVAAGTRVNSEGTRVTQAVFLAQEIREWTLKLPFSDPDPADAGNSPGADGSDPQYFIDDLDDLMDLTYSPPRDGQGIAISDMTQWSQTITLTWRNPADLTLSVSAGTSDIINVHVEIKHNGEAVLSTDWLATRRNH